MSYDIRLYVKNENDKYIYINEPERNSPTYNLKNIFTNSMCWEYKQDTYYKCGDIIDNIVTGIYELLDEKYITHESKEINEAIETLVCLYCCIFDTIDRYKLTLSELYMKW